MQVSVGSDASQKLERFGLGFIAKVVQKLVLPICLELQLVIFAPKGDDGSSVRVCFVDAVRLLGSTAATCRSRAVTLDKMAD